MSLRTAKAKRARITAEQERRRRAAWEKRFATDLAHLAARTEQCLQLLRILEQRTRPPTEQVVVDATMKGYRGMAAPSDEYLAARASRLPDDFIVQPIHRVASR